jgi:hypothetical protein
LKWAVAKGGIKHCHIIMIGVSLPEREGDPRRWICVATPLKAMSSVTDNGGWPHEINRAH